ncbi:hypothetical protein ONZ43_g3701 [Nemania bipapillata]|uniref:Uncharacterized protein n=1 Tax=Nemania bipapillata TaxID=110536 RepID=A0ACC2IVX6_9PEZI|nr:hypothetical protein ONZ43_g3701 [Nemania bipapillata]
MQKHLDTQKKAPAQLGEGNVKIIPAAQYYNIDSAVDMTFPASVKNDLAKFEDSEDKAEMASDSINNPMTTSMPQASHPSVAVANDIGNPSGSPVILVGGMPYQFNRIMEMGEALAKARRERMFPPTITPTYNVQAVIDDFEALERLNAAREGTKDNRDDAFRPEISRLYVEIQRKIQDRDLTHGEVAADSNVRARLSGFANGTGAETGMYNLMRHAVQSVLRLNNLTTDDTNVVDAAASRVINDIRATVQSHVSRGAHGVDGVNMEGVMEGVFDAIENSLAQGVGVHAARLDGQINNMSSITNAQNIQVDAIASHVNAIDSHVHAMGNNVNAMGTLLNSTNGNVTTLTSNISTLQAILNMIPQMVTNSVKEMLPDVIGSAFEAAISTELVARLQQFAIAVERVRECQNTMNRSPVRGTEPKKNTWFSKLNIFKKRSGRHTSPMDTTY